MNSLKNKKAFAKYIIANVAVPHVADRLLPREEGIGMQKRIEGLRYAPSLFNVYIGFKTPLERYGVKHYSTVVCDDSCKTSSDIYGNYSGDFAKRNFIFVDYGQIDSKLAPEGRSVGSICTADYLSDWEHLSKEEYRSKKQEAAETFIDRLNGVFPGIKDAVDIYGVGTAPTGCHMSHRSETSILHPPGHNPVADSELCSTAATWSPIKS